LDDNKKPGARDISDLKARLGLKKSAPAAAASPTGAPAAPGAPGAIPSPFGQPDPAPAAPAAPPDPRRDPFSAQQQQQAANLAAFYGINQQLPGSAEGVGTVEKPKPWGTIVAVLGGGLLVFIVGSFWGGISRSRVEFNQGTDAAIAIRAEVEGLQKNLDKIILELGKGKTADGKPDLEQANRLASLGLKKPDTNKIFHADYGQIEGLGVERLFSYYNNTIKLYDEIEVHGRRTNADKDALAKVIAAAGNAANEKNYGVVIDMSSAIPVAKFAEMGAPVCPKEGQPCDPKDWKGFKYRLDAGGAWSEKPIKGKPGDTITPLQRTPLFNTVASGSVDALAMEAYGRRLKVIVETIAELQKTQKELAADLKKTAERPKVFTF
jgi:hypothetical protein